MVEAQEHVQEDRPRRFRPYPEYKDSGVEWLGEIPAGWDVKRTRHVAHRIEQGWSPDCENREADEDEWGVLKAGCVNRGSFVESEHKALPSEMPPIPELEIRAGDLLMSRASGSRELVGSVAVVPKCRPRLLLCDKVFRLHVGNAGPAKPFLAYALNSRIARWQIEIVLSGGSGLANNIAQEVVKDLILALPASDEQLAIAAFLDRETARIDALVAKKERLIELLQEKRSSLITRAVTKGLDPDVPMKDSGVEWLGEIPTHWEAARMWRISSAASGGTPAKEERSYWDGDIPWVSPKDMKRRFIDSSEDRITEHALAETGIRLIPAPAVLVVVRGMILAHTFPVGITTVPVTINQDMKALRLRPDLDHVFMAWMFEGIGKIILASVVEEAAHGTRAIRMDQWRSLSAPLPPETEQRAIAAFLDHETAKLDALVAKVGEAIERLQEFRTALISAAVTGKIDVREKVQGAIEGAAAAR